MQRKEGVCGVVEQVIAGAEGGRRFSLITHNTIFTHYLSGMSQSTHPLGGGYVSIELGPIIYL